MLSALSMKRKRSSVYIEEYKSSEEQGTKTEISEKEEGTFLECESSEDEYHIYPVERTMQNSTQGRQDRYEQVFPPGQAKSAKKVDEKDKGKENIPKSPPSVSHPKAKSAEPFPSPKNRVRMKDNKRNSEKGWESEDIVMDDVENSVRNETVNNDKQNTHKPNLNSDWQNLTCQRISEISAKVKPEIILDTVLRTPICLEVGELLRTS
jgi:hypothetical protein